MKDHLSILKLTNESWVIVDTHCHLNCKAYDNNREEIVQNAVEAGVHKIIDMGIDLESSKKAVDNSKRFPGIIYAAVGLQPALLTPGDEIFIGEISEEALKSWLEEQRSRLIELMNNDEVAMVGECGMDSYWLRKNLQANIISQEQYDLSLKRQEELFRMQCELAQEHKLTLSIHSRNCEKRCLEIVQDYEVQGVFHSFTGGYKVAKQILNAGFYLGVNGIITYKSAEELRNVYKKILGKPPKEADVGWFYEKGVVFETDSPWLNPVDAKKLNEPGNVVAVVKYLLDCLR